MGDPTAAWVQQELPGALAQALAGYMAPGDRQGATLVARIDDLYLGPNSGGAGPWGASQDTISGTLLVKGPRGGIAANAPIRAISLVPPDGRRPAYARRIQSLAGRGFGAGVRRVGPEEARALEARFAGRPRAHSGPKDRAERFAAAQGRRRMTISSDTT